MPPYTSRICEPLHTNHPMKCGIRLQKGVSGSLSEVPMARYVFSRNGSVKVIIPQGRLPRLGAVGGPILIGIKAEASRLGITSLEVTPRLVAAGVMLSRNKTEIIDRLTELAETHLDRP